MQSTATANDSVAAPRALASSSASHGSDGWDLTYSQPLPPEELLEQIRLYRETNSQDARNRIIESHLRLVAKAARRLAGRSESFDDLMTEGSLALIRALNNFDPKHGVSFTSYASAVVEHSLRGAAHRTDGLVKVPSRERRRSALRYRVEAAFFAEHGHAPVATDLAKLNTLSKTSILTTHGTTHQPRQVSLNAEVGERAMRADALADQCPTPPERVAALDEADLMHRALEKLPRHEARVISLRFGLGDQPSLSASDIAKRLGTNAEDVRHILNEAMRRLRKAVVPAPGPDDLQNAFARRM